MFTAIPAVWQYVIIAQAALILTVLFLWGVNRVQARRERAGELADELSKWGMERLAHLIRQYSQGDYSEVVSDAVSIARDIKSGGAIPMFETVARRIMEHYAATNATKANEFIKLLQDGAALKG